MFQTGSQINPALGRVDYTPYMQGAVAGAQSIGQGIASLGQSIGSGMEAYAKRKKENKMMEASLKANINSLEGLSKIASSLSPQAQEHFNRTMQQLNNPSIPLTEKVVLAEAAQKTVGELINFGMQEKQKQEQATIQQLGYDAAISGLPIPLIYPQSVRAPAAIQSLAIQGQLANIAETKARAKAAEIPKALPFNQQVVSQLISAKTAELGRELTPAETANIYTQVQANTAAKTNITVDKGANKADEVIGEAAGKDYISLETQAEAAERQANLANTLETLYAQGAYTGVGANVVGGLYNLASNLGIAVDKAATQDQIEQELAKNALQATKEQYKGLGALSNLEGQNAEKTVANLGRTPKGNIQILRWNSANAPMLRQAVDLRDRLRQEGLPVEKINTQVKKFIRENYKKLSDFSGESVSKSPAPAPAGGINLSPAALQFIPR